MQSSKHAKFTKDLLGSVSSLSLLMSFKLADMVNIAVEENTYFKSKEWCIAHKDKLFVENNQENWYKSFFETYEEL